MNPYKGKIPDDRVKEYYMHIDTVDSEYVKMRMPNQFEGDCVHYYIRDLHKMALMCVSTCMGTLWNCITFSIKGEVNELYYTICKLYVTVPVLSVWNRTVLYYTVQDVCVLLFISSSKEPYYHCMVP